ncbi:umecyanin-like [Corylus avellana]|uniref:umecyanin-like n=1 Tax=Corylus avellana TaxID=13451 RepID=UPI001E21D59F|nr:umecyanin-like [Corylus avellana]XP_059431624.1 umecyanin-like [Corylus avellana]
MGLSRWLVVVVVIVMMGTATTATLYEIGDSAGWAVPPKNACYAIWATKKTFFLGDSLDVVEVTEDKYNNCSTTTPIGAIKKTSPANFTLTSNATRYFICTVDNHCKLGQKVTIRIGEETASASSLRVDALSAVLYGAIAISFFTFF